MEDNCKAPSVTITKAFLNYLGKHSWQARMIIGSLSLGFLIAVCFVGATFYVQAKHGCFTIFSGGLNEIIK